MAEFATKAVGGTALGLSIGALGLEALRGGIGNLLNGGKTSDAAANEAILAALITNGVNNGRSECHGDHRYDRYDAGKDAEIAALKTEVKLRDANTYTDQKILETYGYINGQLNEVREELCKQRVHNQKTEDSFVLAKQDISAVKQNLEAQIKAEAERRCCADNAIVRYVNATFYPKETADVTVGTTTTTQMLYDPLPDCGGCCK